MKDKVQTWGKVLCGAVGAAVAGPGGAVVGGLVGGLLTAILPGISDFVGDVAGDLATQGLEATGDALASRLAPVEKQRINHDLQTAFRDAFHEALHDVGGERCFPGAWRRKPRDVPATLIYPLSAEGSRLWQAGSPLADQVCGCLLGLETALQAETILPLDPPPDAPALDVGLYLEAETPEALTGAFFEQALAPYLAGYTSLWAELPGFQVHLRRHLLDRTLVHLGELLKARAPAWRAFNRLMLEGLRVQVKALGAGQAEIVERLDAFLAQPGMESLAVWAEGLADLVTATGRIEKQVDEGLTAVLERVVNQHGEVIARFDWLIAATGRIETKVDRVLRFLEDGHWVIEGAPSRYADEPPAPGEPPFMGLQQFDEADADLFFGRELLTARLIGQLRSAQLLVVVGASGSGKSSLVRAGLIPALRRGEPLADGSFPPTGAERWPVHVITPTAHPLEALAASLTRDSESVTATAALAADLARDLRSLNLAVLKILSSDDGRSASRLLLVVDQFEELFTLCRSDAERRAFVDNLVAAASPSALEAGEETVDGSPGKREALRNGAPAAVVITLRADFYAHCADFPRLRETLSSQQLYIGPMTGGELRRAIEEPARRGGWQFEPGLVDLIIRDAGDEPGALPLLSHALLETWKHRRGRVLTLESYAESGGVRGAIAKTAETVFHQHLSEAQQGVAKNLFLRLTELGEGTQDTRRRATLAELIPRPEEAPAVEAVLHVLADARLITTGLGTAEVAHEALIREWPTLRGWLDENRAGLRVHRRLTEAAQEWQRLDRDEGLLYRGARLVEAGEWAASYQRALNDLERRFLVASQALAEREEAEREAQRQRELEAARRLAEAEKQRAEEQGRSAARLRQRAWLLAGALVVAALLAVLALVFAQQSGRNARLAEENAMTAQAASTQAVAQQRTAEAAGAEALQQKATAEVASAEAQRQSRISLAGELAARSASVVERDEDLGLLLAAEAVRTPLRSGDPPTSEAGTALFHALQIANYSAVLRGHGDDVWSAFFSPDGSQIVTASADGLAALWRPDGTLITVLEGHTDSVNLATFSPDGTLILTASSDGTARLWQADGSYLTEFPGPGGPVLWATFAPDGQRVATTATDGTARLWRLDGTLLTTLEGHDAAVAGLAFSPDGQSVVTASGDGTARLWAADGTFLAALEGHTKIVGSAVFRPDGAQILTASWDGTARLWSADGYPVATLQGHRGAVYSAVYSPDGARIVTASDDGTARLWQADGTFVAALEGHSSPVGLALFSPDGSRIVTSSSDATARLWRDDGTLVAVMQGHTDTVDTALFSPDGRKIVTASADGTARVWQVGQTYSPVLKGHAGPVSWASFSWDGSLLVTGGLDNTARLWAADGMPLTVLQGHRAAVFAADFSPDGRQIVTASGDGTARLWRTDGTFGRALEGHTAPVRAAAFSPDGARIVTAGEDGTARLWTGDGALMRTLEGHTDAVWTAGFSLDGTSILTASSDGTARLWTSAGDPIRTLDHDGVPVWCARFGPDGGIIATGGIDGRIHLWRSDGSALSTFEGHAEAVTAIDFSPDGNLMVSAGYDGSLRLWTVGGTLIADLEGHTTWISDARFSPDGSRIVSASWDSTTRLWGVFGDLEAMLAEAARRVGRGLTLAECQRYLHQEACPTD